MRHHFCLSYRDADARYLRTVTDLLYLEMLQSSLELCATSLLSYSVIPPIKNPALNYQREVSIFELLIRLRLQAFYCGFHDCGQ